jgi:Zn-dependent oligopeptidase
VNGNMTNDHEGDTPIRKLTRSSSNLSRVQRYVRVTSASHWESLMSRLNENIIPGLWRHPARPALIHP